MSKAVNLRKQKVMNLQTKFVTSMYYKPLLSSTMPSTLITTYLVLLLSTGECTLSSNLFSFYSMVDTFFFCLIFSNFPLLFCGYAFLVTSVFLSQLVERHKRREVSRAYGGATEYSPTLTFAQFGIQKGFNLRNRYRFSLLCFLHLNSIHRNFFPLRSGKLTGNVCS